MGTDDPLASFFQTNRILTAFSSGNGGKEETSLRVRTLKTLMATLCAGKLMDKLRYIFSQLADANGHLVHARSVGFLVPRL